jgi:hypothetical protein
MPSFFSIILVRLEEDGRILKHWSSQEAIATDDAAIQTFVKSGAFEVMWSMDKGSGAKSFETFNSTLTVLRSFGGIKIGASNKILWTLKRIYQRPLRIIRSRQKPIITSARFIVGARIINRRTSNWLKRLKRKRLKCMNTKLRKRITCSFYTILPTCKP